jgi:hypothetical protein
MLQVTAIFVQTSFLTEQTRTGIVLPYIPLDYGLAGIGDGLLLASNAKLAVVVVIEFESHLNSTVFLVNEAITL